MALTASPEATAACNAERFDLAVSDPDGLRVEIYSKDQAEGP